MKASNAYAMVLLLSAGASSMIGHEYVDNE